MTKILASHLIMIVAMVVIFSAVGTTQVAHANAGQSPKLPMSSRLVSGPSTMAGSLAPANYDEQLGVTFTQDFASLTYNVTAVAQADSNGYGPAYLLDGLTDGGYWYQVGVTYDWPYQTGGYNPGFQILYEVFDSTGNSIFPSSGGGGSLNLPGMITSGDEILLNLYFRNGQVVMGVRDENTSAQASVGYPATGSRFVGLESTDNPQGFFTGLMTEWYHVDPYYGNEGTVNYTDPGLPLTSAYMWADEYNAANPSQVIFGQYQYSSFQYPLELQSLTANGATEYANAYSFITGAIGKDVITLSYSVSGGGAGYTSPTLTYTYDGVPRTSTVTSTPTSYLIDLGTSWSVPNSLQGSSTTERWVTNGQTVGENSQASVLSLVYFHQYLATFNYSIVGGGTGYSEPVVSALGFGSPYSAPADSPVWVDAGSPFSYPTSLAGSNSGERWISMPVSGVVLGDTFSTSTYFHQFGLNFGYTVQSGNPIGPTLTGTQLGAGYSASLEGQGNNSVYYFDSGTRWRVDSLLPGSNNHERWITFQSANGTASAPSNILVPYHHQFTFETNTLPGAGGNVTTLNGWFDAGTNIRLEQTANLGWKFEGWAGTGRGAYSGTLNSSLFNLGGPTVENATFYPGLAIVAGSNGIVSYSYGTVEGTVAGGTSVSVYVPTGTEVALTESPSSILYGFGGWSPGSGSSGQLVDTVSSSSLVQATFVLNYFVIVSFLGIAVALSTSSLYMVRRRSKRARRT